MVTQRMSLPAATTGIVLLGGFSRRMGTPKHTLRVGAESLLERQIRLLGELGCERILLSGRAGQLDDPRLIADAAEGQGPLGGLVRVLPQVQTPWAMVLAVDLPDLDLAFLQNLCSAATSTCGVVPEDPDGLHPLCALYPVAPAALLAQSRFDSGQRALQPFVRELIARAHLRPLPCPQGQPQLRNWNTPAQITGPETDHG